MEGDTKSKSNLMVKLYSTGADGAAIDRHAEYNEEEESVTVANAPRDWMTAFQANGKIGLCRTKTARRICTSCPRNATLLHAFGKHRIGPLAVNNVGQEHRQHRTR